MMKHHLFLVFTLFLLVAMGACGGNEKELEVQSLSISQPRAEMVIGETLTLKVEITPSQATYDGITWTSTTPRVATVSPDGVVTALSEGNTTVTAMAGGKTVSCEITVIKGFVPVSSIGLNKEKLELVNGEEYALVATVLPADATDAAVMWTTSDPNVAAVKDGLVTAIDAGTAVIGAKAGDKETFCVVTVTVALQSVSLDKTQLSLMLGEKQTLHATFSPTNATNKNVTWTSSDPNVASVDPNGEVEALKLGTATITVVTEDGEKNASCIVTVEPIPATSIILNKTSLTLLVGSSETLTATVSPSNATNKNVAWSSSDTDVATVSSDGTVTAVGVGSTVITATTEAGGLKATCSVTVNPIPVSGISLNKSDLTLALGASEVLVATITPSNATDQTVAWTSSDDTVASVDQSGQVVAKATGSARIEASCGGKSAYCEVVVLIPVTSVTLDKQSLDLLVGTTGILVCSVLPSNATNKSVTWTSSNPSVASVDTDGTVLALQKGNATITASAEDMSASCSVTVSDPFIRLNKNSVRVPADASSFSVSVSANVPFILDTPSEVDWLGVEAAENGTWSFHVSGNTSFVPRKAVLRFYSSDYYVSADLTVEQEGKTPVDDIWDGSVADKVSDYGSGSPEDPYLIFRCAQIARLCQEVADGNSFSGKYFKVLANLNFNDLTFTPIGNEATPFSGRFDGGGKSLTGVMTTGNSYQGFFGCTDGAIINDMNLEINTATGSYAQYIGGIAGKATNTTITNSCTSGIVRGWESSGSLVGYTDAKTSIRNCFSSCQNTLPDVHGNVGGLVGYLSGEMQNCHFSGSINARSFSESTTGGVAGYVHTTATMVNCYFLKMPVGAMNKLSYSGSLNWGACSQCGSYDLSGYLNTGGRVCDALNSWVNSHQSSTLTYRNWTGSLPSFVY